jgi:hypothetical protein
MSTNTNENVDRATLAVLAVYGPQKLSDSRAFEYAVCVGAGLAKHRTTGVSERTYEITAEGARHLDATRPTDRSVLERRLERAKNEGNVRDRQAAEAELAEWDQVVAVKKAREAAEKGGDALAL